METLPANLDEINGSLARITDIEDIRKMIALAEAYTEAARKIYKGGGSIHEVGEDRDRAYKIGVKAWELNVEAIARLGELIEAEQEAGRLAAQSTGNPKLKCNNIVTLEDIGLTRIESSRAKEIAKHKKLFKVVVAKAIEKKDFPTKKALSTEIKKAKRQAKVNNILEQGIQDELTLFKELKYNPRPWDVWNFQRDPEYGINYPGNIPAGLIFNLLYFYTEEGDLVVDPMAGGGLVGDVCKKTNRKCLMYDINPIRSDIIKYDLNDGFPVEKANLVFLDPPYYKKLESEYGPQSISSLNREEYLEFFNHLAKKLMEKKIEKVALLMSDYTDDENPQNHIFIWNYVQEFEKAGWLTDRHIMCPLSPQQIHPYLIDKFKKSKKLARLGRSMIIFRRAN